MRAFFRRNPWLIPVVFAAALGAAGWFNLRTLETTMRADVAEELETLLAADVAALEIWADEQRTVAVEHARLPGLIDAVLELEQLARRSEDPGAALSVAAAGERLKRILAPTVELHEYMGFAIANARGVVLAASLPIAPGSQLAGGVLFKRLAGLDSALTRPVRLDASLDLGTSAAILLGARLEREGKQIGILGFALPPGDEFTRILSVARSGATGETYAFDADGLLVSQSRFSSELRELGLLAQDARSALNVQIRDPGGDMTQGHVPELPVLARPLTRMAASAIAGESGVDVKGYPDYRGVPVVGAWTWLPGWEMGVATEVDVTEAYAPLVILRQRFGLVVVLLVLGAIGMLVYSLLVARLRGQVDEARQLGRYRIEGKIGAGGMGTVYLARHALLRRPTALKVLERESADHEMVARFEREVQVTSGLTHPNTIEIFDFGYNSAGVFYYAMEYLNGTTLGQCVEDAGAQTEARVVHIMKQACGSIAEAHRKELIHRDLKPANIMLCEMGGLYDFVKVLDFGLVRSERQSSDIALTDVSALTGTPQYLPPEAVQAPEGIDVRADLYQLGAIAYYLLTGQHVFGGDTVYEVLAHHVGSTPKPPSEALGKQVSPDLEKLILRCLEKDPKRRFANGGELYDAFESLDVAGRWDQRDASEWWVAWREQHPEAESAVEVTPSQPSGYTVDLAERLRGGEEA